MSRKKKNWVVGRNDGHKLPNRRLTVRFESHDAAAVYISTLPNQEKGIYFLDGPSDDECTLAGGNIPLCPFCGHRMGFIEDCSNNPDERKTSWGCDCDAEFVMYIVEFDQKPQIDITKS